MQRINRIIFGDDIFISYSRRDGYDYALRLSAELKEFSTFIDQIGSIPGKEIPHTLRKKLLNATILVIIGTPCAAASDSVAQEISLFSSTKRPIVPISVDGALEDANYFEKLIFGLAVGQESQRAVAKGVPSQTVIDRIEKSFNYTRRRKVLRNLTVGTIAFVLLAIAGVLGWSNSKLDEANAAIDKAQIKLNSANTELYLQKIAITDSKKTLDSVNDEKIRVDKTLAQVRTDLRENIESLDNSDSLRQIEQGNLAIILTSSRGQEKAALSMGLKAVTSRSGNGVQPKARLGLARAWYNYRSFTPLQFEKIQSISISKSKETIALMDRMYSVHLIDANSLELIRTFQLKDTIGIVKKARFSEEGDFLSFIYDHAIYDTSNFFGYSYKSAVYRVETSTGQIIDSIAFDRRIEDYTLSADGTYLGTRSDIGGSISELLEYSTGNKIINVAGLEISDVYFHLPDSLALTVSDKEKPKIWKLPTGMLIDSLEVDSLDFSAISITAEGYILTGHDHAITYVWNFPDGGLLGTLDGHSKEEYFETIEPLNQGNQPMSLTNVQGGKFHQHENRGITALAAKSIGNKYYLATAGKDRQAILWSENSSPIRKLGGHNLQLTHVLFSPTGFFLASADQSGMVRIWDPTSGRALDTYERKGSAIESLKFLGDHRMVILFNSGEVVVWNIFGDVSDLSLRLNDTSLASAIFTKDGQQIITTDWIGNLQVWDAQTGDLIRSADFRLPEDTQEEEESLLDLILQTAKRNDQNEFSQPQKQVDRWQRYRQDEMGNRIPLDLKRRPNRRMLLTAVLSPDGKYVLCQNYEGRAIVYELSSDEVKQVGSYKSDEFVLARGTFSLNGQTILLETFNNPDPSYFLQTDPVNLKYKLQTQNILTNHKKDLQVNVSPSVMIVTDRDSIFTRPSPWPIEKLKSYVFRFEDSPYFLTIDYNEAQIISLVDSIIHRLSPKNLPVTAAAPSFDIAQISYNGRYAAFLQHASLALYDMKSKKFLPKAPTIGYGTFDVQFSPDNQYLATAGVDRTIRLFKTSNLELVADFRSHAGVIYKLSFSPDSKFILSTSQDNTAKLFRVPELNFLKKKAYQSLKD